MSDATRQDTEDSRPRLFISCKHADDLFTYLCYTADLSRKGLDALGLAHIHPEDVQKLDSVEAIPRMREVGRAVAERKVRPGHLAHFAVR